MLSILGPKSRCCDGISRRGFMKIGGLFEEHMTMIRRLQRYESIPNAEVSKREEENLNELKRETTQNSTDPKYQICF